MSVQTVRDTFNFNVVRLPLVGPDNAATPHYGLFRDDDGSCVGNAVSKKYVPHTTEDVVTLTEAAYEAFGDGNLQCYWNNGHHVVLQPTNEERRAIFGTQDNIFIRCVISAGYDGRPFRASLGMFRDACKNLMIPKMVEGTTAVIRHTKSSRIKISDLIGSFERVRAGWDTLAALALRMDQKNVLLADFLNKVYGDPTDSKRGLTMHKERTEAICNRILNERIKTGRPQPSSDFEVSVWECLNGVQGYVQHESGIRNADDLGRIFRAAESPVVAAAERLALSLSV